MFFSKILCLVLVTVALTATHAAPTEEPVQILSQEINILPNGRFTHGFKSANGISEEHSGIGGQNVEGKISYTAPDGTPIEIKYRAVSWSVSFMWFPR